jgi:N-carbamoyl-L-amino-acid hydrolase
VEVTVEQESLSPSVLFDAALRERLTPVVRAAVGGQVPVLGTGAGHDAGVLAAHVPTAMLFVRNPTGVSHSPAEAATDEDCATGIEVLAAVLRELAT